MKQILIQYTMIHNYIGSRFSRFVLYIFLFSTTILTSNEVFGQTYFSMSGGDYSENFSDITNTTNWPNGFNGPSSTEWNGLAIATGTGIPTPLVHTISTLTFTTGATSGVQRGTGTLLLFSSGGDPGNTSSAAIELNLNFSGRTAGNISCDLATVNNGTGSRGGTLRLYASTNGSTFFEISGGGFPYIMTNNVVNNVSASVALPASLNNQSTVKLRFYYHNGPNGASGSRPKVSIDNIAVTSTAFSGGGNDNLSDITSDAAFTPSANIDYTLHQETDLTSSSLEIGRFVIRDGGASADADAVATILSSITFNVNNGANVRRVAIYDGSTELAETAGGAIASFTGLTLSAPDGGTKVFSLRASFNSTVTDNNQISYVVNNVLSDVAGSGFATTNAGAASTSTAGNDNRIEVTASAVIITTQPVGTAVNTAMPNVVAIASDAFNNRDFDFAGNFTATSTGALTGSPVIVATTNGLATFTGLTFTATGIGLTLSISAGAFTAVASNAFNIVGPPIMAWDFTGASSPATFSATSLDANISAVGSNADVTRGAGASSSSGSNSFRTQGFQNNGINTSNTDYFQVTVVPNNGFKVSLSTIDANLIGTASFAASPGVSSQFAYSLDGTNFTLIGSPSVTVGQPVSLPQIDLSGISALQNVSGTITLRYYASGQTNTGGWGFNSPSAGTNGLAIGGVVEALQCNDITACNYNVSATSALD
ncbi:MAG: beta strand repeat-containing protein [Flavobacteriales bacterium]